MIGSVRGRIASKTPPQLMVDVGGLGYELARVSNAMLGWGTFLLLILSLLVFIIYYFNVTSVQMFPVKDPKPMGNDAILPDNDGIKPVYSDERDIWTEQLTKNEEPVPEPVITKVPMLDLDIQPVTDSKPREEPVFIVEEPRGETDEIAEQLVGAALEGWRLLAGNQQDQQGAAAHAAWDGTGGAAIQFHAQGPCL